MAKQRFVVYKAINKTGSVMRSLLIVGGKSMPFFGKCECGNKLNRPTQQNMVYGSSCYPTVNQWKQFAKSEGACRFQKVIYFN